MNLPNALTLLRIFLVPVLVVVLLTRTPGGLFLGAAIFGVAVLTDYLDGYFARRRNQVTRLGILLDPIADKLLTAAAFISLVEMNAVPAWMVSVTAWQPASGAAGSPPQSVPILTGPTSE